MSNSDNESSSRVDFISSLLQNKHRPLPKNKITVIGVGQVGMACAVSCLTNGLTTDLFLYDVNKDKLKGEVLDLEHASLFLHGPRITAANELSETANSKLIIVTAGARQRPGEKRPALMARNLAIFKSFIPEVVKHSPDAVLLIISNPVDVMTYISWKLSGLPASRVIGSGTNLDTSRFRHLIAKRMNINVRNVHGWIIGEHGDSSVPVWSGVNIAGVSLRTDLPKSSETDKDPDNWNQIHKDIVNAAYEVIALKGYTSWAVGFSVGQISEAILRNRHSIHPVSTYLKGEYGVEGDIFASVPCVLGEGGVLAKIKLPLTQCEQQLFDKSINEIEQLQSDIHINSDKV